MLAGRWRAFVRGAASIPFFVNAGTYVASAVLIA